MTNEIYSNSALSDDSASDCCNTGHPDGTETLTGVSTEPVTHLENCSSHLSGPVVTGTVDGTLHKPDRDISWAAPDVHLLGDGRAAAPEFPLKTLPSCWAEWALNAARDACAPVDFVIGFLLPVIGAMLSNVRRPIARNGWSEPTLVWTAIVGDPSFSKSPALEQVGPMIAHVEAKMSADRVEARRAFDTQLLAAKNSRDRWEAEVKKASAANAPLPQRPASADEPIEPVVGRLVVQDSTIEAVAKLAAGLPRGLLAMHDELSAWAASMGQYKAAANGDRGFWLKSFGGKWHRIDRKTAGSYEIPHLSVGVTGGIQPARLRAITGGEDDGLAVRFFYFYPSDLPKFDLLKKTAVYWTLPALDRILELAMEKVDDKLAPKYVPLSDEASDLIVDFANLCNQRVRESFGLMKGMQGKARGHAMRVAAIIEYLSWAVTSDPEPDCISKESMSAAIEMLETYILPMAERVFAEAAIPPADAQAKLLIQQLRKDRLVEFNARDLTRASGTKFRDASALKLAIETLEQACLVRPGMISREGPTKGRAKGNYEVNPRVHA